MTFRERFDDAINPIVVKELRQAVRGRFVVSVVTLSLVAQLIAVAVLAVTARINLDNVDAQPVGLGAFMTIFTLLFTACIFFVPMYSGFRMASERSVSNAVIRSRQCCPIRAKPWSCIWRCSKSGCI